MSQTQRTNRGPVEPLLIRPALFIACLLLLAGLALRHPITTDVTANGRHSLVSQTTDVLALLQTPLDIEVFIAPDDAQRPAIAALLNRYADASRFVKFSLTDPALNPERSRRLGIASGGELLLNYQGRQQRLNRVSQESLTLAVQRLLRSQSAAIRFVSGHAERAIDSKTAADFGVFAQHLKNAGYDVAALQLTDQDPLDAALGTLVIAGPMHRYLPAEVAILLDYLSRGGNLLWLTEPDSDDGLKAIEYELGIQRAAGVIVDLASSELAVDRPDFALATQYQPSEITRGFNSITLFPQAVALEVPQLREWQVTAVAQTGDKAWTETSSISGEIKHGDDPQEIAGPLNLALALERNRNDKSQRVVIVGDGDFLADAWIGNGGNRDFGTRLFSWISADQQLMQIDYPAPADRQLALSSRAILALSALTLIGLPGGLLVVATGVWYRQRYG